MTGDGEAARGLDTVCLSQGERRVIEFSYKFPGMFMFHPHQNTFAERGAMGHFLVA
jgi:FtsP/CotA-like multicopper oxidase with cupredoxin domain